MGNFFSRSYHRTTSTPHFIRHITSWCLPPLVLACLRLLFSIYIFATSFTIIGLQVGGGNANAARVSLSFFTILTWYGLAFYFLVSAIHGFIYSARGRSGLASNGYIRDTEAGPRETVGGFKGFLRWAHSAYYATVTIFPFIVTAVFWGLLANGALYSPLSTWSNVSQHGINSAFALFEVVFPRTEATPWIHVLPCVIILAMYLGLTYLSHSLNGFYVYPFLDQEKNGRAITAAYIIGILVAAIIVFAIVHFVIKFRRWLTEAKCRATGKFSRHDVQPAMSEQSEHVAVMVEKPTS
ncbi:hypothetical protein BDZ85DRAFT_264305 [Elsinoe ampelina]|uniref:FAR-17a/AIG1-like protein n=1 Tax=Elsinoe ampelina TaxID=302913 RepID=A0A6A6G7J1_9PEZI|nr:hypothetical protein BDZ85DRAFT_264305 [Elsinoe ampelina]